VLPAPLQQAIYLDRVQQLKTAAKAATKKLVVAPALQVAEEDIHYNQHPMAYLQEDHHHQQHQQQPSYQVPDLHIPQDHYQSTQEQYHLPQDPYQQLQQQPYHPPPPPTPPIAQTSEKESSGFKLFGKKKSKTQADEHAQQPTQDNTNNNSYNYAAYNDYNYSNNNINNISNGGYISPPYSEPQMAAGSPAALITPVFMTQSQTPSPTPPIASIPPAVETPEQSTKSSRWKPFGKKKSKSFSAGETSSGPYCPPDDYEIPAPPLPAGSQRQCLQQYPHLVDPGDHADAYSQQQHADWYVGDDIGPVPMNDYEQDGHYYDEDEDEDVDPYYIADTRGRAQAYEGKVNESSYCLIFER